MPKIKNATTTVVKGHAILQMPCGCNTRKFKIRDDGEDHEGFMADMEEINDFIDNHKKICWSKPTSKKG